MANGRDNDFDSGLTDAEAASVVMDVSRKFDEREALAKAIHNALIGDDDFGTSSRGEFVEMCRRTADALLGAGWRRPSGLMQRAWEALPEHERAAAEFLNENIASLWPDVVDSAGRWCAKCHLYGLHHTDRHEESVRAVAEAIHVQLQKCIESECFPRESAEHAAEQAMAVMLEEARDE